MFDRILVAVDGSPAAFAAALFGAEVAGPGAALHLLCVCDRGNPPMGPVEERSLETRCETVLASAHAAVAKRAFVGSRETARGRTLAAILQLEEAIDADLVCLGSGRARLRPGHVAAATAREAHGNVAIIRERAIGSPRLSRLVAGLRDGPTAVEAARRALRIAAGTGAAVHLVSVGGEELERRVAPLVNELGEEAEEMGLSRPHFQLRGGDPAGGLVAAVEELRADLLLVGTGQRRPLRPLGRAVTRLTSTCPCPLLICRLPGEKGKEIPS